MIGRSNVITEFLKCFKDPSYLEIGVNRGETFNSVSAACKTAVDPKFEFSIEEFKVEKKINFFETTSDDFFSGIAGTLGNYDVIFLDGLHTFEQTLRDFINALSFLNKNGVIIIDDVLPNSFDASLPDLAQVFKLRTTSVEVQANWPFSGSWMGDVFKLPFFIETFFPQLSFATILENHGQTVVWRQTRPVKEISQRSVEMIARLDYRDTILSRGSFNIQPLGIIIDRFKAANM